ncbi:MAG: hypothetical protein H6838_01220 [Planctomycetes bacterium]|nr:hypothetical protein [Planctomycetota bacterium]
MFRPFSSFMLAAASLAAQSQTPAEPPVRVPTYPNSTCPIMGKKVSMSLFVDTDMGRFYLCCKPCVRKVLADVPTAHKTAYPVVEDVANEVCPVSGEPIGEHKVSVVLQGFRFSVCCAGCVEAAQKDTQLTLIKLREPGLVVVGNRTCPISGKPVVDNAVVVIGDNLVHLASPRLLEDVEKAPAATLAKAREIAKAQPKPAPHRHVEKSEDKDGGKDKGDKGAEKGEERAGEEVRR